MYLALMTKENNLICIVLARFHLFDTRKLDKTIKINKK